MKTKKMSQRIRKADKRIGTRRSHKRRTVKQETPSFLVRDLMKPIYLFGRHAPSDEWITDRETARAKIAARENFYLRVGERVYFVNLLAYPAFSISPERIVKRIDELLT